MLCFVLLSLLRWYKKILQTRWGGKEISQTFLLYNQKRNQTNLHHNGFITYCIKNNFIGQVNKFFFTSLYLRSQHSKIQSWCDKDSLTYYKIMINLKKNKSIAIKRTCFIDGHGLFTAARVHLVPGARRRAPGWDQSRHVNIDQAVAKPFLQWNHKTNMCDRKHIVMILHVFYNCSLKSKFRLLYN